MGLLVGSLFIPGSHAVSITFLPNLVIFLRDMMTRRTNLPIGTLYLAAWGWRG